MVALKCGMPRGCFHIIFSRHLVAPHAQKADQINQIGIAKNTSSSSVKLSRLRYRQRVSSISQKATSYDGMLSFATLQSHPRPTCLRCTLSNQQPVANARDFYPGARRARIGKRHALYFASPITTNLSQSLLLCFAEPLDPPST